MELQALMIIIRIFKLSLNIFCFLQKTQIIRNWQNLFPSEFKAKAKNIRTLFSYLNFFFKVWNEKNCSLRLKSKVCFCRVLMICFNEIDVFISFNETEPCFFHTWTPSHYFWLMHTGFFVDDVGLSRMSQQCQSVSK